VEKEIGLIGDGTAFSALVAAVRDLRQPKRSEVIPVGDDVRIDGRTCLVTGANSGLGRAAAVELARRGGNLILACRPGHGEICEDVRRRSGSATVEMMEVDLSDLGSLPRFCDLLDARRIRIDVALMNAGLIAPRASTSAQG